MRDYPLPPSMHAVCGFLSIAGYYCKFGLDYNSVAAPLLTEGFLWFTKATMAFDALNMAIIATPVLALPDFARPFIVKCDVSTYGFGAVLLQDKHPIAFFNRPVATSAPLPSFI